MNSEDREQRLSQISTVWTEVFQTKAATADAQTAAQQQLVRRYSAAVYRYLLGAVRDAEIADELFQEFALRFVRGDFQCADPQRGRFRDYVRRSLVNLITGYRARQARQPRTLPLDVEPTAAANPTEADQTFLNDWRDELLARSWEALARWEREKGQPFHSTLQCRTRNPDLSSAELAERLGAALGRPLTASGVRQTLRRAREKFADLLIDEIARSIRTADLDAVEQELVELGLHSYCQETLRRRKSRDP